MDKRVWLVILTLAWLSIKAVAQPNERKDIRLLNRIYNYIQQVDTAQLANTDTYTYRKLNLKVVRRNITLFPIPTMYRIAHSKNREYIEENYEHIHHRSAYNIDIKRIAHISTIPQQKETMTTLQKFLTPKFYEETIFGNNVLSPFHRNNNLYYTYQIKIIHDQLVEIHFYPKVKNTQLVEGYAFVDATTGRIIKGALQGEFDMISFTLIYTMPTEGNVPIFPIRCELNTKFKFMGNVISAQSLAVYGTKDTIQNRVTLDRAFAFIDSVRKDSLTLHEQALYQKHFEELTSDSLIAKTQKRSWAKRFFWDVLGDNLLNKISSSYGDGAQGEVHINPIFNPLYMGYSGHKGYYYKFDIRSTYRFDDTRYLYGRIKAGYSFKQRQLYYTIPFEYHFNKKHNGYIKMQFGNGNWISNGLLKDELVEKMPDTTAYDISRASYFRDLHLSLESSYDLSQHFTLQGGIIIHRRTAVEQHLYAQALLPISYTSVAPKAEIIWRPTGRSHPVINAAYERSIRGFLKADIAYERWEFDMQHIVALNRLRFLSFRTGCGFYTLIDGSKNFLDYTNFRDNNIPDGWYDEWTGEFNLLPTHWYNLSRYYVRGNMTYETPLLSLSHLPLIGHYIEKERIYANVLCVTHLHPYTEIGYGFTTRWASIGIFMAHRNGRYDGIGIKLGLELFRQW